MNKIATLALVTTSLCSVTVVSIFLFQIPLERVLLCSGSLVLAVVAISLRTGRTPWDVVFIAVTFVLGLASLIAMAFFPKHTPASEIELIDPCSSTQSSGVKPNDALS